MTMYAPDDDTADGRESSDTLNDDNLPDSRGESVVPMQFEIPAMLKARLDALAAARGMTYSEIVRLALLAFITAEEHLPER
jgi:hypothetical protein